MLQKQSNNFARAAQDNFMDEDMLQGFIPNRADYFLKEDAQNQVNRVDELLGALQDSDDG